MQPALRVPAALLFAFALTACQEGEQSDEGAGTRSKTKTESKSDGEAGGAPEIESSEILGRKETADEVDVKHVLLGWKDLADIYRGRMDPRARERTQGEAAELAEEIAGKLREDPGKIDSLVKEHSEDPGSLGGKPYTVTADAQFVPEFKKLALRLKMDEVGIVQTDFGYHVMVRVTPPPPDPLASSDILEREPKTDAAKVRHVLIGWKDVPAAKRKPIDPRAKKRTKEDADELAKSILEEVRGGAEMKALMKEHSEDPGSKDSGKTYPVTPRARLVDSFKELSLRLEVGEAGMVVSPFGWHVIKRVE